MRLRLSSFSIKYQIGLIGTAGVAGLLILGAIYASSESTQARQQAVMDQAAAAEETRGRLAIDLLQARRAEKDFLLRHSETYLTRYATIVAEAIAESEKLITLAPTAALAATARDLTPGIKAYSEQFGRLGAQQKTLGLNESSGLLGALRGSVHEVEEQLKQYDEPRLAVLMLMMRRHEKDFLARLDPRYGEEMKKRVAEFAAALAGSAIPPAARSTIESKLAAYQRDFFAMLDGSLAVVGETKKLSDSYAKLEPVLAQVEKAITENYTAAKSAIEASRQATSQLVFVAVALVTLLVSAIAFVIGRALCRSAIGMTKAMGALAGGDTAVEVPARERKDEFGEMAKAVQVFKDNMIEAARLRAEQEELKKCAEAEQRRAMNKMADEFEASIKGVVQTVSSAATELQTSAQSMSATAEETSRQSTAVAAASEEASTSVQTVASAAEELSASIAEISRQVGNSAKIASKAVDEAAKTNTTVHGLAEAAQKIGDVVKLINDIAGQTNLLALNATIEAARAGEAGKGFAVVASEVKSLANQTAKATDEIAAQINAMQGATNQSVEAIKGIGNTIAEINEIATTIAAAVEEQGAATQEIARNVQQASAGTSEVSSNIAGVTQASAETGAAASQVLGAAGELSKQSETLRHQVDSFLAKVRAA